MHSPTCTHYATHMKSIAQMEIEQAKQKELVNRLLAEALHQDEVNKGGFSNTQAQAWRDYSNALNALGVLYREYTCKVA